MSEVLYEGDPPEHVHDLPEIPDAHNGRQFVDRCNAVARCGTCGRLFVSREDPDGWGRVVVWVPLRWWHRRAKRALRAGSKPSEVSR